MTKTRRPRYRTLREDYVQFCDGNVVASLLLDYFASADRIHDEQRTQGETPSDWRAISGRFGGLITCLQPQPTRETIRRALDILVKKKLIETHPDNGLRAEPNTNSVPNRYRLIAYRLLEMERAWTPALVEAGGDVQTLSPPDVQTSHESVVIESDHDQVVIKPTEQQQAVGILARFYEARAHQMLGGYMRRELDKIAEDFTLAEIERAILAVGDKELERPFQYLRKVLSNTQLTAAAPVSAAGSFWGRDLTDGE
jgi:hypothetical protein